MGWNYCSMVDQLNYLTGSLQGKLAFAVHQCCSVQFSADLKWQQKKAVMKILQYLTGTPNEGLIMTL
jgi:hypothetical protein